MLGGSRALLAIATVATVVSVLAALINIPTSTPYSPFNTGGDGYSQLVTYSHAVIVGTYTRLEGVNASNATLILPVVRWLRDSGLYNFLRGFLKAGGTVVVIDSVGYSNPLISYLGVNASVEGHPVLDEVLKLGDRFHPLLKVEGLGNLSSRGYVASHMPSSIRLGEGLRPYLLAVTSRYAYADLDGNGFLSPGEVMRPYAVVACWRVGRGSLALVADYALFSNSLINYTGNRLLLTHLTGLRRTYFLTEGLNLSGVDRVKAQALSVSIGLRRESASFGLLEYVVFLGLVAVVAYVGRWAS